MSLPSKRSATKRLPPGSPIIERLWFRSVETPEGCWVWQGPNHLGYGTINVGGKTRSTHRVSYELHVGPIPAGLQIDHLCRVRGCWRPDHLEAVTPLVNTHRAPDQPATRNARKTHCNRGHELAGDNLRINIRRGRPQRECLKCKRIRKGTPEPSPYCPEGHLKTEDAWGRPYCQTCKRGSDTEVCPNGHPYSEENVRWRESDDGATRWRVCRACVRERKRRERALRADQGARK